jgi:hypothetical protein
VPLTAYELKGKLRKVHSGVAHERGGDQASTPLYLASREMLRSWLSSPPSSRAR